MKIILASVFLTGCISFETEVKSGHWNTCARLCGLPLGLDMVIVGPFKPIECQCRNGAKYALNYNIDHLELEGE